MKGRIALAIAVWVLGSWSGVRGWFTATQSADGRTVHAAPRTPHPEPDAVHSAPRTTNPEPEHESVRIGFARPGGGYDIRTLPLETYVGRVLAGEAVRDSRPAALEALAITLRTFALANPGRHRADGFDLCDQTHCQVVRTATAATDRAAAATAGRVLLRNRAPASVYYSASCGGRTEVPSHVWPGAEDPPYMPSRPDDACEGAPAWSAELDETDLLRALRSAGFRGGRLGDLTITARHASGRVALVRMRGVKPDTISGQDLRVAVGRTLGWQHIKSTQFDLRRAGRSWRFTGHGSGHGVGLCVIGSARLAEAGRSAEQILARYFPGLAIGPPAARPDAARAAPPPAAAARSTPPVRDDVILALPDGDEGERTVIAQIVSRERDDLARTLGVAAPAPITLRVHPTADDYERATGQAWFTSGALVKGELHLLPLIVLRERGVLERTVRHELVHLMTDPVLGSRSAWVREGAAIYFAGERPIPGEIAQRPAFRPDPRQSCPTDAELLHPVSVGALSNAYARARACFAKQMESRKSWKDVR